MSRLMRVDDDVDSSDLEALEDFIVFDQERDYTAMLGTGVLPEML